MARLKLDSVAASAIDLTRAATVESGGKGVVGEHVGVVAEGERVVTHFLACLPAGYPDRYWAVTLVRASRAWTATVNEAVLFPHTDALLAPARVPWERRIQPEDVGPGVLMTTPDSDPHLEPGFAATNLLVDADPVEWAQLRSTVAELGLGRERVLSAAGRDVAAECWFSGTPGNGDESSRHASVTRSSCGYFVPLRGSLGILFGVCADEYSSSDARVVSLEHGYGEHSDVAAAERAQKLPVPVSDTIGIDEQLFN